MTHVILGYNSPKMADIYSFLVVNFKQGGVKNVLKPPLSLLLVSDTDPVKPDESEGDKRLGAKERRRQRKERRSTGIVQSRDVRRNQKVSLDLSCATDEAPVCQEAEDELSGKRKLEDVMFPRRRGGGA